MTIPAQYNQFMPYLILDNAAAFFPFTQKIFGATQQHLGMRDDAGTIMHGEIKIGDQVIMYAGTTDQYKAMPAGLFIYVDDADKSYAAALAAGATSVMDLSDQSYGRTCGVLDPCGNTWWITSMS